VVVAGLKERGQPKTDRWQAGEELCEGLRGEYNSSSPLPVRRQPRARARGTPPSRRSVFAPRARQALQHYFAYNTT